MQSLDSDKIKVYSNGHSAQVTITGTYTKNEWVAVTTIDSKYVPKGNIRQWANVNSNWSETLVLGETGVIYFLNSVSNYNVLCVFRYPLKTPIY